MKNSYRSFLTLAVAFAFALFAGHLPAQTAGGASHNLAPGAAKAKAGQTSVPGKHKTRSGHPFHGKLAAVDKAAKTITVGKSVYHLNAETKIKKGGKPATLDAAVIGEVASGYVKPASDGTMTASSLNLGPKPDSKTARK